MPHIVRLQTLRVNRERLPRLGKGHAGGDREAIARLVGEGDVLRFHCGPSLQGGSFLVNTSVYDFLETSFMPIAWTIAVGTKVAWGAKVMSTSSWHEDCYGAPPSVSPSVSTTYARRGPKKNVPLGTGVAERIF